MDKLDQYLEDVEHLPPTPTLVVELLDLFKQPDRDIDRVVELISHDPSLTAEVLKRCNSAYLGGGQPAEGMFEAVTRLGFYEVYCTVVAAFGAQAMTMPGAASGVDVTALWQHSVVAAVAAAELAKHTQESEGIAFTSGLLHDFGKLILASKEGGRYAELLQTSGSFGQSLLNAEQARLKLDHAEIGGRLLARWDLPPGVVAAALHHHRPAQAREFQSSAAIAHLADVIAHAISESLATAPVESLSTKEAMMILKLATPDEVVAIMERTREGLERVKSLMEI